MGRPPVRTSVPLITESCEPMFTRHVWRVTTVLSSASGVLIKVTRRAYLPVTEFPSAKSFVRNILSISSLKAKILVLLRL